ncbi:MAG TPA: hypothetical protein VFA33_00395 [Bryobacteraceae bacterium]|nr:hypothetical protein [Bryobacteraceae bacterium]
MKPKFWLMLLFAVVLAAAAGTIIWQARTIGKQNFSLAQASAEKRQLRARAAELDRQLTAARAAAQAPVAGGSPEAAAKSPAESAYAQAAVEAAKTIQTLQESLARDNASINDLQNNLLDLQGQVGKLTSENQRLSASESDLTDNLASARRLVDALQRELKSNSDRLTQTQITDQKLRQQATTDSQRISQLTQGIADLQDIYLRQEATLNRILRRYRELTDQYRTLSGMMDNRRTDVGGMSTIDVSRIQNSIALAEEDLRQFSSLTAQAQRIQRKLTGK